MASSCMIIITFILWVCISQAISEDYTRPKPRQTLPILLAAGSNPSAPQQAHISTVGLDKMRVTWITEADTPSIVHYGTHSGVYTSSNTGSSERYSYMVIYKSGYIHDVVIGPLQPNKIYYYRCGGSDSFPQFSFKTPPAQLPINLAVIGDLGQTGWTITTLQHVGSWNHDMLILPGDLSYADYVQPLWDSFGRLVEPLASKKPWMVTQGNHEVEKIPLLKSSFRAYNARWKMPFEQSGSNSNLYYSFDTAGGAVHVIMLGSYADYKPGSDQHAWLESDLNKINRKKTPWVFAVIHAPWYNTNTAHQREGEGMRLAMEDLLYKARIDVVFSGHVHAYERFDRVYNNKVDPCGAVHITIGDGGNKERLAKSYKQPKPSLSLFREASFGHGRFQVMNETHAKWSWNRNDDDVAVVSDNVWLVSLSSQANQACH